MKRFSIFRALGILIPLILFSGMMMWLIIALSGAENSVDEKELDVVKSSIENGVTMCYAIEGVYPGSLDYLKENYGIVINEDRYIVNYECFADNIRPVVNVLERRQGE